MTLIPFCPTPPRYLRLNPFYIIIPIRNITCSGRNIRSQKILILVPVPLLPSCVIIGRSRILPGGPFAHQYLKELHVNVLDLCFRAKSMRCYSLSIEKVESGLYLKPVTSEFSLSYSVFKKYKMSKNQFQRTNGSFLLCVPDHIKHWSPIHWGLITTKSRSWWLSRLCT